MNIRFDLRSDTVTMPSEGMREAMASAPVGDDVYGEDPSVNALQDRVAAIFGKEAGLFVPSGSMSNQLAIKAQTDPGDEVICDEDAHVFRYETGAPGFISGVQIHTVGREGGAPSPEFVAAAVRPPDYYYPRTRLLCVENTHNRAGGLIVPIQRLRLLRELASERGLSVHLDGARIWNAHVASAVPLREYGDCCDTLSVCFSKGLGAPVGSMLLGRGDVITRAHKFRKMLGGAMRQAGILAAGADYALSNNLDRLAEDHKNAKRFARALAGMRSFEAHDEVTDTNMVMLRFDDDRSAVDAQTKLRQCGVLIGVIAAGVLRAVFHLNMSSDDTDSAIRIFKSLFA